MSRTNRNDILPPSYEESNSRSTYLALEGGGTRIICQTYLLCEIMHRLAWDLKIIDSNPGKKPKQKIYPKDCFDYIGATGCGSIIAFYFACGMTAEQARDDFYRLAASLETCDAVMLQSHLEAKLPQHEMMWHQDNYVTDYPAQTNIWIMTNPEDEKQPGILIKKGTPVLKCLLPLVIEEVLREQREGADRPSLNLQSSLLRSLCPVFEDCGFLLSMGGGDVPKRKPVEPATPWLASYFPFSIWSAPEAPVEPLKEPVTVPVHYVPGRYHGRTYVRLNPNLTTYSRYGEASAPEDWEGTQFSDHKSHTNYYCSKVETGEGMDAIVRILRRRGIPMLSSTTNDREDRLYTASGFP